MPQNWGDAMDQMDKLAADIVAGRIFAPVGVADAQAGYAFQDLLAPALAGHWGPVVGWKIAMNSPQLMAALGQSEPASARVFQAGLYQSGQDYGLENHRDLRIEPEIALRLATTPEADDGRFTPAGIRAATDRLLPAFEVIDMRGATRESAPVPEAIAQNVSNLGAVLGGAGVLAQDYDGAALDLVVRKNDAIIARAKAGAPQDPFEATAWLANQLAARGLVLEAGAFVLCGTHTDMLAAEAGDHFTAEMAPLGTVSITL